MARLISYRDVLPLTKDKAVFEPFLLAYRAECGSDLAPLLEDCLIGEFTPFLDQMTVLEITGPGCVIYRMCGTRVVERMGADPTGINMIELLPEESQDVVFAHMDTMATVPCGNYARFDSFYEDGRCVETECLALPVRSATNDGKCFILSIYAVAGKPFDVSKPGKALLGSKWTMSIFLDVGNGIPAHLLDGTGASQQAG